MACTSHSRSAQTAGVMPETEAVRILSECGIPYPRHGLAHSSDEAQRIADGIGYPVVLKATSPDIVHKSDVGAVSTGLATPREVRHEYVLLLDRVHANAPSATLSGVLVCQQAQEGLEVIIGGVRDLTFGAVVAFGLGGIFAEVHDDVAFAVAPVDREQATGMLRQTRAWRLLNGVRGGAPLDQEAVIDLVVKISEFMWQHDEVAELDLNPVRVYSQGAVALDTRMVLR